ncbi:MAG TPA: site-2 protease family protein [Kofleriaceae bacterium]|nr:site-2 protease family protein [Kofleriaceae bacterium]
MASITVHEFGHAIVAHKLGDRLPMSQGRVTLNPIAHADPIGTIGLPLMFLVMTGGRSLGFGWGRPVQVSPISFTRKLSMRTGHMLVAAAGPFMNFVLGCVVIAAHAILIKTGTLGPRSEWHEVFVAAASMNFILMFFNLIPAPPLDGGAVVRGLIPHSWVNGYDKISVYGPFVLMAVVFIPQIRFLFVEPAIWMHRSIAGLWGLA